MNAEEIRQQEADRVRTIHILCEKHRVQKQHREHMLDNDFSVEQARNYVLNLSLGGQREQQPIAQPVNPLGLTEKEQSKYSICRAILSAVDPNYDGAGYEREISTELAKKAQVSTPGMLIPVRDLRIPYSLAAQQRATYATSASNTGGATVETMLDASNMIEFLRNTLLVTRMGARMLSGLQGNVDLPRVTGVANTYWVGEGGALSKSEATFDLVSLRPKTVGVISEFTRNMLLQSSIDIEAFVRQDIADSIAQAIDLAVVRGSGTANQPLGILNFSNANQITIGANGGSLDWKKVIEFKTKVARVNADRGSLGWMLNPDLRGYFQATLKNPSAANSDWIWEEGTEPAIGRLAGYPAGVTNQLPFNLTKGTGTDLSAAIFGNWSDIVVGEWGVLQLDSNPYISGAFESGNVQVRAMQTIDVAARRQSSFSVCKEIVTNA